MSNKYITIADAVTTANGYGTNESSSSPDTNENLKYLKHCFESSIYTRLAEAKEHSLIRALIIGFMQIFIPISIIIDNHSNYEECSIASDIIMSWDTIAAGTLLIYFLWLTIMQDTLKSMRGLEFLLGLQDLPRPWGAMLGLILTPISGCLTGIAASVALLNPQVTVVDVAKDSMALFFIIRLDEDFGKLPSIAEIVTKRFSALLWKRSIDHRVMIDNEDDDDAAERLLDKYGPFISVAYSNTLIGTFTEKLVIFLELFCYCAAIVVPFIYFGCAI